MVVQRQMSIRKTRVQAEREREREREKERKSAQETTEEELGSAACAHGVACVQVGSECD